MIKHATNAMYRILGVYKRTGDKEILDSTPDKIEAEVMLEDYRMSFGREWSIKLITNQGRMA